MSLHFINAHGTPLSLSVIWFNRACDPSWRKTGWWNLANGQMATPIVGNLNARYYYVHAEAWDGSYWGESPKVLITDNRFDVCLNDILEPSYLAGFAQIDTGPYTDFTVRLT
jgi:uncharacterized membrane protein